MKIHKFETESQYQAHIHGRKAPRGSRYVPKSKVTEKIINLLCIVAIVTILIGSYLMGVHFSAM